MKDFKTFCESYDWICRQSLRCYQSRRQCSYTPNSTTNNTVWEQPEYGIPNFLPTDFSQNDDPRERVLSLFRCNKKYGYRHRVFIFFLSFLCPYVDRHCDMDIFGIEDPLKFEWKRVDLPFILSKSSPAITTKYLLNNLTHAWYCQRDMLATVSCEAFLLICNQIKECLIKGSPDEESLDLPRDDTCFSPLPRSTLNPLANGDEWTRGYSPGILGDSVSFIVPLQETYSRSFDRLNYSGWETKTRRNLKERRTNLFFSLFIEDCRFKHQFEGFLIEPYFTEAVDYMICSIPFGLYQMAENPLVTRGCSRMRDACEGMTKCYEHHVKHFRFHSLFNRHGFALAIFTTVIFISSTVTAAVAHWLRPTRRIGLERCVEYSLYACFGLTSISLLVFIVQTHDLIEEEGVAVSAKNRVLVPTIRLCWHLSSYFLTIVFHLFIVSFTFRSVYLCIKM